MRLLNLALAARSYRQLMAFLLLGVRAALQNVIGIATKYLGRTVSEPEVTLPAAGSDTRASPVTILGPDELAFIFEHCDSKTILRARLALKSFAAAGAAAVTSLYAREGLLDDQSWKTFPNAFYLVTDGLGQLSPEDAHARLQRLMTRIPARITVIKAYSDYVQGFASDPTTNEAMPASAEPSTKAMPKVRRVRKHMPTISSCLAVYGISKSHDAPGLQFLDCDLPFTTDHVDSLCQTGRTLRSLKLKVYAESGLHWYPTLPPLLTTLHLTGVRINPDTTMPPTLLQLAALTTYAPALQHCCVDGLFFSNNAEGAPKLALQSFHVHRMSINNPQRTLLGFLQPDSIRALHMSSQAISTPEGWAALLQLSSLTSLQLYCLDFSAAPELQPAAAMTATAQPRFTAVPTGPARHHRPSPKAKATPAALSPAPQGLLARFLPALQSLDLTSTTDLQQLMQALQGHQQLASLSVKQGHVSSGTIWWQQQFGQLRCLRKLVINSLHTANADALLADISACALEVVVIMFKEPTAQPEQPQQQPGIFVFGAPAVAQTGAGRIGLSRRGLKAVADGICSRTLRRLFITCPLHNAPSVAEGAVLMNSSLAQRLKQEGNMFGLTTTYAAT